jgi:hypothetical protein
MASRPGAAARRPSGSQPTCRRRESRSGEVSGRGKAREKGWKGMGSRRGKAAPDSTVAFGEGMGAATVPPRGARETQWERKRRAKEKGRRCTAPRAR